MKKLFSSIIGTIVLSTALFGGTAAYATTPCKDLGRTEITQADPLYNPTQDIDKDGISCERRPGSGTTSGGTTGGGTADGGTPAGGDTFSNGGSGAVTTEGPWAGGNAPANGTGDTTTSQTQDQLAATGATTVWLAIGAIGLLLAGFFGIRWSRKLKTS